MSRYYRKPYTNLGSIREDKKIYHQRYRAKVKSAIDNNQDIDELYTPVKNIETSDIWSTNRDGKQRYVEKPKDSNDKYYREITRK